ncbi:MAG: hypothetical protein GY820_05890 [Gammaproteobacteria bacterium]|nr:hypothetical protein [Gammaproteobacteria bacterium]
MEGHKKVATGIFFLMALVVMVRDGLEKAIPEIIAIFVMLLLVVFSKNVKYICNMTLYRSQVKSLGPGENSAFTLFFWIAFVIVCLLFLYK